MIRKDHPAQSSERQMQEFPVDNFRLFKNASKATGLAFLICIPIGTGVNMIGSEKARNFVFAWITDPVKMIKMVGVIGAILGALLGFIFILAWFAKLWKIRLDGERIYGRNYYGFSRSFPLDEIIRVDLISNNGISGWLLKTNHSGSIYLLSTTRDVEYILQTLERALEKNPA